METLQKDQNHLFEMFFLPADDLVTEEMDMEEEDITSELPCTLSIEDTTEDSMLLNTDEVGFSHY